MSSEDSDGRGSTQITRWHAANRLREEIIAGMRPGDKIDPEAALAGRYGVARNTMRKALDQLREEGILRSVHGRGTFAAAVPERLVVRPRPGDTVRALFPDEPERARRQLPPGVPLLVVTHADGSQDFYDASRTLLRF